MADEQKHENSGAKEKGGKRRYFRRNKNKKPKSGGPSPAEGAAKAKKTGNPSAGERQGSPNKKRRSRRRRSPQRSNLQIAPPELIQEPDRPYEEPTSVYIYTHIVRPAYRDVISEYRPETAFQQSEDHGTFRSGGIELLTKEIREQLDRQFSVETEDSSASAPKHESAVDDFDEEDVEDFEDDEHLDNEFDDEFDEK